VAAPHAVAKTFREDHRGILQRVQHPKRRLNTLRLRTRASRPASRPTGKLPLELALPPARTLACSCSCAACTRTRRSTRCAARGDS
jgi:hypothetical protein